VPGPKLNERPVLRRRPESRAQAVSGEVQSAKALARYVRVSPYKVREVLDLIRGYDAERAQEILKFCERDAAIVVGKVLGSAMANAEHDHALVTDELYVSACFADEGPTLKRWRPRARGRATRIRKRTCHVTVIVYRLPDRELQERRARRAQGAVGDRRRRRSGAAERAEQRGRGARRRQPDAAGSAPATPAAALGGGEDTAPEATSPAAGTTEPSQAPEETTVEELLSASDEGGAPPEAGGEQEGTE
jgi:large subunit ribosomal protein L22